MTDDVIKESDQTFHSELLIQVVEDAVRVFDASPFHPLPPSDRFVGSGILALYYTGDFPAYQALSRLTQAEHPHPIYVGMAIPARWRTGTAPARSKPDLYKRLLQHAQTIEAAQNLNLGDFRCRFIILNGLESELIGAVAEALILRYKPIWNTVVSGFGMTNAGDVMRSRTAWDTLHPGRAWATRMAIRGSNSQGILTEIGEAMTELPRTS